MQYIVNKSLKKNVIYRFFSRKYINLLIRVSNTIDRNTKSKMLKIFEDDTTSKLIEKNDRLKAYVFDSKKKMYGILKILDL